MSPRETHLLEKTPDLAILNPCAGECVFALDDDPPGVFVDVTYDPTCFVEVFLPVVIFMRCVCLTKTHINKRFILHTCV